MKRILKTGILVTAFSMLFTGCGSSSLVSGVKGGYQEIEWAVKETEPADAKDKRNMPTSDMPDYYEDNEKAKKAVGTPAFKIADAHSDNTKDIENFEVGNLLSDGTFLYCYTTKVGDLPTGSETDNRKIVHCAAAYNYKSEGGQFKVFHENTFTRVNEDSESFYMQLCSSDGDGDIFIYDNGIGYLYNASGEKKYEAKIEEFVRKHFKGYSIVTTQALTDGQNRIYVDLAIEKTEISAAPESTNTGSNNSNDDDAVEKEAEALDKEFSDKLIEIVLVYDIKEYSGSIDQTNLKLDDQIKYWQELRDIETGYEGWTPSAETDWEDTLKAIPDEWGAAHLYFLPNWNENQLEEVGIYDKYFYGTPVFQWNGEPVFGYRDDGCVSDFVPDVAKYRPFTEVEENTNLTNVFVKIDGHYYTLYGETQDDLYTDNYSKVTFSRTVKRVDYITETTTDPETNETTETKTAMNSYSRQSVAVDRKRDSYLKNCYLEGYWTLDNGGIVSVFEVVDGYVFCLKREGSGDSAVEKLCLLNRDGTLKELGTVTGASFIDIYKQNDSYYISVSIEGSTMIFSVDLEEAEVDNDSSSDIPTLLLSDPIKKVFDLETAVDSKYHDAYDNMVKDESGTPLGEDAGEHLDGTNSLYVALSDPQKESLDKIKAYVDTQLAGLSTEERLKKALYNLAMARNYENSTGKGYLISSMSHGLIYLDHGSRYAFSLDEGTWYGIWPMGDKIVAVGYSDDGTSYDSIDKAHACVKEFDIDTLYANGLQGIVDSMYGVLANVREVELSDSQKELLKQWEEDNKDRNVTFITPENGADIYDAWKDSVPGELTQNRTTETTAAGENGQNGQ